MAQIKAATNEKVFMVKAFLGLNQNPDGDTKLKMGEASESKNFRVTRDGNLQRRPGTKTMIDLHEKQDETAGALFFSDGEDYYYIPAEEGESGDIVVKDEGENAWHIEAGTTLYNSVDIEDEDGGEWYIKEYNGVPDESKQYDNEAKPLKGLWTGYVNGNEYMLGAYDGVLYKLWDSRNIKFDAVSLGNINTDNDVFIFGFSNIVYILDGEKYRQWDGTELKEVHGYRPLVMITIPPVNGSGESATLENVNRLCPERRIWLSPDGTGTRFAFPEPEVQTIDYVKDLKTGDAFDPSTYSLDDENNEIVFTSAPASAPDSIEVGYSVEKDFRSQVEHMQYAELFSGTQDTRVFLYGDGTNKCLYSGIDYNGEPRADYFPDLYECLVGDENTPITGMIRHYSSLACFKKDSAWSITAGSMTLAEGLRIPSFYVTPVNKEIGNAAPGQIRLVMNNPFTLFGNDLYEWKNSSYYTSNLTRDERQAKRISDRVWKTLERYTPELCYCYDDNDAQEYYICYNKEALVYNYAVDAWTEYTNFPVSSMTNLHGECYIGTTDGKLKHLSTEYLNDDGAVIPAYWESGSIAFGQEYMRKYSAMTFIGVKSESRAEVNVSVRTDRKLCDTRTIKTNSYEFDFATLDFGNFAFDEERDSKIYREKIKAKKFIFYKLLLTSDNAESRCTVLSADIRVRFTGFVK